MATSGERGADGCRQRGQQVPTISLYMRRRACLQPAAA